MYPMRTIITSPLALLSLALLSTLAANVVYAQTKTPVIPVTTTVAPPPSNASCGSCLFTMIEPSPETKSPETMNGTTTPPPSAAPSGYYYCYGTGQCLRDTVVHKGDGNKSLPCLYVALIPGSTKALLREGPWSTTHCGPHFTYSFGESGWYVGCLVVALVVMLMYFCAPLVMTKSKVWGVALRGLGELFTIGYHVGTLFVNLDSLPEMPFVCGSGELAYYTPADPAPLFSGESSFASLRHLQLYAILLYAFFALLVFALRIWVKNSYDWVHTTIREKIDLVSLRVYLILFNFTSLGVIARLVLVPLGQSCIDTAPSDYWHVTQLFGIQTILMSILAANVIFFAIFTFLNRQCCGSFKRCVTLTNYGLAISFGLYFLAGVAITLVLFFKFNLHHVGFVQLFSVAFYPTCVLIFSEIVAVVPEMVLCCHPNKGAGDGDDDHRRKRDYERIGLRSVEEGNGGENGGGGNRYGTEVN